MTAGGRPIAADQAERKQAEDQCRSAYHRRYGIIRLVLRFIADNQLFLPILPRNIKLEHVASSVIVSSTLNPYLLHPRLA